MQNQKTKSKGGIKKAKPKPKKAAPTSSKKKSESESGSTAKKTTGQPPVRKAPPEAGRDLRCPGGRARGGAARGCGLGSKVYGLGFTGFRV